MKRPGVVVLVALLALAAATPRAGAQPAAAAGAGAADDLRLERRLLALDLVAFTQARAREQQSRQRLDEVLARLDQALAASTATLGALEGLEDELAATREAAHTAADRVDARMRTVEERLRRIGFLEGELNPAAARPDPISGRWRVRVMPQDRAGTFELHLHGTVVSGNYQMDGGASGSLRGTYVNNALRLERIDAHGGFDSTFLGTVDAAIGQISGSWTANELAAGQPARGGWSAVRSADGERQP
jgi:hypothetical protein